MNARPLLVAAVAIVAASCGGGAGAGSPTAPAVVDSIDTDAPETTAPATTTSAVATSTVDSSPQYAPGTPLIGAVVPAEHDLLFTTTDPAWALHSLIVSYEPVLSPELLLLADGDDLERPVASVTVGARGVLDEANGNTATMGAVIEPVRVGGVDSLGWSAVQNDVPISGVQWPAPNGYQAAMMAIGLDLEAAAELAAGVGFDGTTATFEGAGGFHAMEVSDPNARTVAAVFAHGSDGIRISCANSGEAGMFGYQVSALARVAPRSIGGGVIGQRADATFGPSQTALDGAAWVSGEWWCQVWSWPLTDGGGEVPVIADDQAAALLASLTIVDEPALRAAAGDASLVLDVERPAVAPASAVPTGPFSGGEAAATGSWHAVFAPDDDRIMAVGTRFSTSTTVVQFIDASTGEPLMAFPSAGWGCGGRGFDVAISDDGTMLWDGQAIRDTTTGRVVSVPEVSFGRPAGADFSSDGLLLAVSGGRDKRVVVVSTATGEVQHTLASDDYIALCGEFLPGDLQLHVPGLMPADRIWNLATEEIVATFTVDDGPTLLSADGKYLAIGDLHPRVVEVDTGHEVPGISGYFDEFSGDSSLVLVIPMTSGLDGSTGLDPSHSEIWDLHTGQRRCVLSIEGDSGTNFSPDGSRLVSTRAGSADVYDTSTCKVTGTLEPDDGGILSVDYSSDGTQIVTAKTNGHVQTWSAP